MNHYKCTFTYCIKATELFHPLHGFTFECQKQQEPPMGANNKVGCQANTPERTWGLMAAAAAAAAAVAVVVLV